MKLLFRRFLGKPLTALGVWSDQVAAGEFGRPPPSIDLEELRSLADKFANMSEKIESRERSLLWSEKQFRRLFENSEISIWNEDLSAALTVLNDLRQQGITDLRRHLDDNPHIVRGLMAGARIVQVNAAALKLFDAKNKAEIISQINNAFTPDAIDIFKNLLCALWNREKSYRTEAAIHLQSGKERHAIISFPFPETEEGFQSVPVSIIDITELKQAGDHP